MASLKSINLFPRYLTAALILFRNLISYLLDLNHCPIFIKVADSILSLYFWLLCDLSPITVDFDDKTSLHFWTASHRRFDKKNLVMIHGYGGNSKWQFVHQVANLSRKFNLFIPDLVFFGRSFSKNSERTDRFQAECVAEGLRRLGVQRFSIYGISYGGFVAYRMAEEICPSVVEKLVIVSSGLGCTQEQKAEELTRHGRDMTEIFVPKSPHDLRLLVNTSMHNRLTFVKWVPDLFLRQFIHVMYKERRRELVELLKNLLEREEDPNFPIISKETLIVWGDKDEVFPMRFGHQLHRRLPNSRLEIIQDVGHGVNIEAPKALNDFIIPFVSGSP